MHSLVAELLELEVLMAVLLHSHIHEEIHSTVANPSQLGLAMDSQFKPVV
jgi:hypothetical protein